MVEHMSLVRVAALVVTVFIISESSLVTVSARYLPTRGQDDRLDRLRELLKDMLQNDYDRRQLDVGESSPRQYSMYKRSAEYSKIPAHLSSKSSELFSELGSDIEHSSEKNLRSTIKN